MKYNLLKVDANGRKSIHGKWWMCKVTCDICGKELYKDVLWATPPNMQDRDICDDCKREN